MEVGKSSNSGLDIFDRSAGSGGWTKVETDIIRKNITDIKTVLEADIIGPSFTVYDVSGFVYK